MKITPALFLCAAVLGATTPSGYEKYLHVRVAMRDGVHLDTNVFKPSGNFRFPVILLRTPYGKGADLLPGYNSFLNHGYAVVMQDVRGRYGSEGVFDALKQEGPDGYDTINWIAAQPWSNGQVGMMGGSYLGIAQWRVALLNNPHLKAIFPVVAGSDDYLDRFYSPGGATKLGHRLLWFSENLRAPGTPPPKFDDYVGHLPLRTSDRVAALQPLSLYQTILNHPTYDSFWKDQSVFAKLDLVRVPVFEVGGWYDNYVESDLEAFSALHKLSGADGKHRILIGPWAHNMSTPFSGIKFGDDSSSPIRLYQLQWFDHWLKGAPEDASRYSPEAWHQVRAEVDQAPVHIFVMGVNRWRDEQEWPLARTHYTPLYLTSKGRANTLGGDGKLDWKQPPKRIKPDLFAYDPRHPVPTRGGAVCCDPKIFPWGPMDQRPVEQRGDVLVYTSAPLKQDLEVTGPVHVVLYASTSALDTDFTAKLVDVFPNGVARNLTDGILRVRYRDGLDRAELAQPGAVYALTIDAGVTSNVFLAGHSIRIEISSSNFPRFDRNPNTGRAIADETVLKKADQQVYHSASYPSHVLLPVIPVELRPGAVAGPGANRNSSAAVPPDSQRAAQELTSASSSRYGAKRSPATPSKAHTFQAR
ncbi:MAG TPA: CocE/NonD family hydrolase [Bryobacteraceae bacterium]|nr:CocE/NonD family hydrolase [Bryobacteraceae bacterium]